VITLTRMSRILRLTLPRSFVRAMRRLSGSPLGGIQPCATQRGQASLRAYHMHETDFQYGISSMDMDMIRPMLTESLLTNHARVLLAIARGPDLRLREIADLVGISERRVHGIVTDLTDGGYLTKQREGRRNRYSIHTQRPPGDGLGGNATVSDLLEVLVRAG